jgi:hypothetical protein
MWKAGRSAPKRDPGLFTRVTASEHRGWCGYRWSMAGEGRTEARTRRPARDRARATAVALLLTASVLTGCGAVAASSGGAGDRTPPDSERSGPESTALSAPAGDAAESIGSQGAEGDAGTPRVGTLVEDFPVDLLPVPHDAVLLVTSAVPVGGSAVREVSLNLRTRLSVSEVMRLYRAGLTEAGFSEVTPPTDELGPTADATFTRSGGDELVTIGVVDVDGARTLTLGGRVRTEVDS